MRITGLGKTIENLTAVRGALVEQLQGPEAEVKELKRQIDVIEESVLDKKTTIKELDNSLEALKKLDAGITPKNVKKVEEV